jgi:hypothetical protein
MESIESLAKALQTSISPVALISGIGLLLLTMTNRLARTIDRSRLLSREMKHATGEEQAIYTAEINILYRRARLLQRAIACAAATAFLAALIVVCLFGGYLFHLQPYRLVILLFALSLVFLIVSLGLFLHDLTLALQAFKLDVGKYIER